MRSQSFTAGNLASWENSIKICCYCFPGHRSRPVALSTTCAIDGQGSGQEVPRQGVEKARNVGTLFLLPVLPFAGLLFTFEDVNNVLHFKQPQEERRKSKDDLKGREGEEEDVSRTGDELVYKAPKKKKKRTRKS